MSLRAACTRHSPSSGFSCDLRISFMLSSVTFRLGCLGAWLLSSSSLTPSSTHLLRVAWTVYWFANSGQCWQYAALPHADGAVVSCPRVLMWPGCVGQ